VLARSDYDAPRTGSFVLQIHQLQSIK